MSQLNHDFPCNDTNEQAFSRAKDLIPGGVDSPVRAFQAVGGTPVFMEKGKGSQVWDIQGRAYTDWCASWGALILGHAPASVTRAAARRMKLGSTFGAPTREETRLARLIRDAMPGMERLRFVSSGTEAVMSALRLARGFTGRKLVLKFDGCYHGHADHLLVSAGSGLASLELARGSNADGTRRASSAGVPEEVASLTLSVPYNNLEAVRQAFRLNPGQIAAVIVEPVAANMGLVLPAPGFLQGLREVCTQEGSLLVFDEVITGFRLGPGGAQGLYGIKPDLSTLGKIIGGGFPAAAYGGRADIMALLAPGGPVYQAGTLSGNPVAMEAGAEVLSQLARRQPWESLAAQGAELSRLVRPSLDPALFSLQELRGLFTLFCRPSLPQNWAQADQCSRPRYAKVFHGLLARGHYTACAQFEANFVGNAHKGRDIKSLAQAMIQAAAEAAKVTQEATQAQHQPEAPAASQTAFPPGSRP